MSSLVLVGGQRLGQGLTLLVRLSRGRRRGVETPAGHDVLRLLLGLSELDRAGLLGHDGALVLGGQLGHQLGSKSAGLLRIEVTDLFGDIN